MTRRRTSRKVALTATFLTLAAGGAAACDASAGDDFESPDTSTYTYEPDNSGIAAPAVDENAEGEEDGEEVFYCADDDGEIVDEENCADDDGSSAYFIWHSTGYARGLTPGTTLDGGDSFPAGDRESRRAFKLPTTGKVTNGTIKTNVVGRGSSGSTAGGTTSSGG